MLASPSKPASPSAAGAGLGEPGAISPGGSPIVLSFL